LGCRIGKEFIFIITSHMIGPSKISNVIHNKDTFLAMAPTVLVNSQ
jgi:hypothetical protein